MSTKGPYAFRTISETADSLGVQQHVLRFWETKFTFVRPTKRAGGRRFYRPQDIILLQGLKTLLHDKGYTIRGVQKLHKEQGQKAIISAVDPTAASMLDMQSADPVVTDGGESEFNFGTQPQAGLSALSRSRLIELAVSLEAAQQKLAKVLGR